MVKNQSEWGGKWTEKKLESFEKYVRAYLKIMNSQQERYPWWKLIYFDAFAGSGVQENDDEQESTRHFVGLDIEPEEFTVYKGAAERVLSIEKGGFDFYYFIDSDQEASNKLQQKLEKYILKTKCVFRVGDANQQINKLAKSMRENSKYKALALLDPFGMQVNWDSIQKMEGLSVDLWILLPSGVAVNRLLKRDGTLLYPKKLIDFFGMSEYEIKSQFYKEKTEHSLFGSEKKLSKVEESIGRIAEIYQEKLQKLFQYVAKPKVLRNNQNAPIYHFVFASNSRTAVKIADDIIGKDQR